MSTTRPLVNLKWMIGLQLSTVVNCSDGQLRTWYCNSVLIFAAAATLLSGHHNKEDAIAVLKVKLTLVLYHK